MQQDESGTVLVLSFLIIPIRTSKLRVSMVRSHKGLTLSPCECVYVCKGEVRKPQVSDGQGSEVWEPTQLESGSERDLST